MGRIVLAAAAWGLLSSALVGSSAAGLAGFAWDNEVVDAGVSVGGAIGIALDANDEPHLAFADEETGVVRYARRDAGEWQMVSVPHDGFAYGTVSLAMNGRIPHVAFYDGDARSVEYAFHAGDTWVVSAVDTGHVEAWLSLALDPDGVPHVAYTGENGDLRHARFDAGTWVVETVDARVVTARYASLAFDSRGNPQIAYYGDGLVLHNAWVGYRWDRTVVDDTSSPQFVTLRIDPADVPKVGYRDILDKELMFAEWNGSAWVREVAVSGGDVGWDARLALDADGQPHFSYYDRDAALLKYARRADGQWATQIVDRQYIAGWYSALAVGRDGRPHFAYYSFPDAAVRYAVGNYGLGVRTWPAQGIAHDTATLVGEVTSLGGNAEGAFVIEWRLVGGDWQATGPRPVTGPTFLSIPLEGLRANTTYEFRAVLTAGGTRLEGETIAFRTSPPPPPRGVDPIVIAAGFVAAAVAVAGLVLWLLRRQREDEAASHPEVGDERGHRRDTE